MNSTANSPAQEPYSVPAANRSYADSTWFIVVRMRDPDLFESGDWEKWPEERLCSLGEETLKNLVFRPIVMTEGTRPQDLRYLALARDRPLALAIDAESVGELSTSKTAGTASASAGLEIDLRNYFVLGGPASVCPQRVLDAVRKDCKKDVLFSYREAGLSATLSDRFGRDVDLEELLGEEHLDAIGAPYAWQFLGGDGVGVRLVDIEEGWYLEHPDLLDAAITLVSGQNRDEESFHGTSVLGILTAARNRRGTNGIVPGLTSVRVVSIQRAQRKCIVDAIVAAIRELRFGDVLLLEKQTGNTETLPLRPTEIEPAVFDAIRLATALGIVVVEPAGNGGSDLDVLTSPDERELRLLDRLGSQFRDSGAIMVAASQRCPAQLRDCQPISLTSSNFGHRIDCFAWGEKIWTPGIFKLLFEQLSITDDESVTVPEDLERFPDTEELYRRLQTQMEARSSDFTRSVEKFARDYGLSWPPTYKLFGNTSAASAIIAGVTAAVQGLSQAHLGYRLSPWQVRLILRDPRNGRLSGDPEEHPIGSMPHLKKVIDEVFNIPADVYVRDHVGDDGERPRALYSTSPDIIIQNRKISMSEPHSNENLLQRVPAAGDEYHIHLRLHNRGGEDRFQVTARIYGAPIATFLSPSLWREVCAVELERVQQADTPAVSHAILWSVPEDAPEDYGAWIVLVDGDRKPTPTVEDFSTWESLRVLLRHSNNFARRNIHRVEHAEVLDEDDSSAWVILPFCAPGFPDEDRTMRFEVLPRLPKRCWLWLEMPEEIADLRRPEPPPFKELTEGYVYLPLNPNGRNYFREVDFDRGRVHRLRLLVYVPAAFRQHEYRLAVRQLCEEEEVGRVTWWLVPNSRGSGSGPGELSEEATEEVLHEVASQPAHR